MQKKIGKSPKENSAFLQICPNLWSFQLGAASVIIWLFWLSQVDRAGWYDEFAVISNTSEKKPISIGQSMDWLQSLPPGYYWLCRAFLKAEINGLIGIRLISAVATFAAALLILSLARTLSDTTKAILLMALCLNPVISQYALAAKPYALEILLGICAYWLLLMNRESLFLLLIFFSVPFTGTLAIFNCGLLIYAVLLKPNRRIILASMTYLIAVAITTQFTSNETQNLMRESWFGNMDFNLMSSLKGSLGNLLWLPVSGLGLFPEMGSSSRIYQLNIFTSVAVFCIVFLQKKKSPGRYIIALNLTGAVLLQTLQIAPAAGRLLLPMTYVIWLELAIWISRRDLQYKFAGSAVILFLVVSPKIGVTSNSNFGDQISLLKEQALTSGNFYSTQDFAPLVKFALRNTEAKLSPNLIIQTQNRENIYSCRDLRLNAGDTLILPRKVGQHKFESMVQKGNANFWVYSATKTLNIRQADQLLLPINCDYKFGNPASPMGPILTP